MSVAVCLAIGCAISVLFLAGGAFLLSGGASLFGPSEADLWEEFDDLPE